MSSTSPDVLTSLFPLSIFGVACLGVIACSAPLDGEPLAETTSVSSSALSSPAIGACQNTSAGVVTSADSCAGTGAGRIVVKLRNGMTCDALFGAPMGALTASGVRKSYLFATAPASIRETYCVVEDGNPPSSGTSDARAESILGGLCASASVDTASRDCSTSLPRSSDQPNAYAPPGATVVSTPVAPPRPPAPTPLPTTGHAPRGTTGSIPPPATTPPTTDPQTGDGSMGKNSCDVCVTAGNGMLFVALPPSFATSAPSTLAVRVSTPGAADLYVAPPLHAQSFVVDGVAVPDGAAMTIYAPGVTPPPREPGE